MFDSKGRQTARFLSGKLGRIIVLALAFVLIGFLLGQAAGAGSGVVPGSEEDPLATASWVEAKIQNLENYIRQLEGSSAGRPLPGEGSIVTAPAPVYRVVNVLNGKFILTGEGTEVILRSGKAAAVEGPLGDGLSDLTAGVNLAQDDAIQRDHLVLSPREDGRGILTCSDAILLIRGTYQVK
jgi:hypothetical protein